MSLQCVVDEVRPLHVSGGVEAFDSRQPLSLANSGIREMAGPLLLLDLEINALRRWILRIDQAWVGGCERGKIIAFASADHHDPGTLEFVPCLAFDLGELTGDLIRFGKPLGIGKRRAADNQRRSGFIDEDVVHLVDNGIMQGDSLNLPIIRVGCPCRLAGYDLL